MDCMPQLTRAWTQQGIRVDRHALQAGNALVLIRLSVSSANWLENLAAA